MSKGKSSSVFSWRDIQQGNRRSKTTKTARKRSLMILFRSSLLLLLVLSIVAGIFALRYFGQKAADKPVVPDIGPLKVSFSSDGVLTEAWFKEHFASVLPPDLRKIEVRGLKESLEAKGQVAAAAVTVSLPSTLQVVLEEREPILRLRVRGLDGNPQTLLIARDGTVYEGAHYPEETLRRLPGVAGLRVRRTQEGFVPIEGLHNVAVLLDYAKERLPALYRHWRVVDLSDWDPELNYRSSLVRVSSVHIEQLVFSTDHVEEQVERLGGILEHIQRYQLGQPKLIDLSFGEEAVIRYN